MFASPDALWLLALVPALLALVWGEARRRRERLGALGDAALLGGLTEGASEGRRVRLRLLAVLIYALVVVGLAGPRFGERTELLPRKGLDVVFAIDVSSSMRARDVRPDRLERTKAELSLLFDRLREHRIGIVAFAGTAFVQCPLTDDVEAARLFLSALDPSVVPQGGTDLGAGLLTARNLFEAEAETNPEARLGGRLLVVVTDGEDHEGGVDEAARALKEAGVSVLVLGVGSRMGEPIPLLDGEGTVIGYKKDRRGDTVMTRLSTEVLEEVAAKANGHALEVMRRPDFGASEVEAALGRLEKRELEARIKRTHVDRSAWPLALAFVLLVVAVALPERKSPRARRRTPFVAPLALSLLLGGGTLFAGAPGHAQGLFSRTEPNLVEGEKALKRNRWDEAITRFRGAETHGPDERAAVEYDVGRVLYEKALAAKEGASEEAEAESKKLLQEAATAFARAYGTANDHEIRSQAALAEGNAHARAGELDKSVDAYRRSLVARSDNERAKKNLATVLRALKQQQEQQQQEQQQQEQQQQEEQGDDEQDPQEQDGQEDSQEQEGSEGDEQQEGDGQQEQQQEGDESQQGDEERQDPQAGDDEQDASQAGEEQEGQSSSQEQQQEQRPEPGQDGKERQPPSKDEREGQPSPEGENPPTPQDPKAREGRGKPKDPRQEQAERLLDALRQRERPLNPLLMQPRKGAQKKPPEKDW